MIAWYFNFLIVEGMDYEFKSNTLKWWVSFEKSDSFTMHYISRFLILM